MRDQQDIHHSHEKVANELLRYERKQRGWSQTYVAQQLDTNAFTVNRWERGVSFPSPHYRQKLCELFVKSAQELGLVPLQGTGQGNENASHPPSATARSSPHAPATAPVPLYDPAIPPLPLGNANLVGREVLLQHLKQNLLDEQHPIKMALNGLPGVGKTAVAVVLAHDPEVMEAFQDGILWAGLGRTPYVAELLNRWGKLLGLSEAEMSNLSSREKWMEVLRTEISMRRILFIIDDVWSIEDALAFEVGGPRCVHLVTTRSVETALNFADNGTTTVSELSEDEGILLLKRFAPEVVIDEHNAVCTLVRSVGGLPLALTLMGRYLLESAILSRPETPFTLRSRTVVFGWRAAPAYHASVTSRESTQSPNWYSALTSNHH